MLKAIGIVSVAGIVLAFLLMFALGMNPMKKSAYSNCVVVDSGDAFIGKYLKFEGQGERMTLKTEQCIEKDKELDGADGPEDGRVRWVECPVGPDCGEMGMI